MVITANGLIISPRKWCVANSSCINQCVLINVIMQQENIQDVFTQNRQPPGVLYRVHASLSVLGIEWKRAAREDRAPHLEKVGTVAINKGCENAAVAYPNWPAIFRSTDLSAHAEKQPLQTKWWLPERSSDEGMCISFVSLISHSALCRSSRLKADQQGEGPCPTGPQYGCGRHHWRWADGG
jgi:hypothetical protein